MFENNVQFLINYDQLLSFMSQFLRFKKLIMVENKNIVIWNFFNLWTCLFWNSPAGWQNLINTLSFRVDSVTVRMAHYKGPADSTVWFIFLLLEINRDGFIVAASFNSEFCPVRTHKYLSNMCIFVQPDIAVLYLYLVLSPLISEVHVYKILYLKGFRPLLFWLYHNIL